MSLFLFCDNCVTPKKETTSHTCNVYHHVATINSKIPIHPNPKTYPLYDEIKVPFIKPTIDKAVSEIIFEDHAIRNIQQLKLPYDRLVPVLV
jgi:hypothetical protein